MSPKLPNLVPALALALTSAVAADAAAQEISNTTWEDVEATLDLDGPFVPYYDSLASATDPNNMGIASIAHGGTITTVDLDLGESVEVDGRDDPLNSNIGIWLSGSSFYRRIGNNDWDEFISPIFSMSNLVGLHSFSMVAGGYDIDHSLILFRRGGNLGENKYVMTSDMLAATPGGDLPLLDTPVISNAYDSFLIINSPDEPAFLMIDEAFQTYDLTNGTSVALDGTMALHNSWFDKTGEHYPTQWVAMPTTTLGTVLVFAEDSSGNQYTTYLTLGDSVVPETPISLNVEVSIVDNFAGMECEPEGLRNLELRRVRDGGVTELVDTLPNRTTTAGVELVVGGTYAIYNTSGEALTEPVTVTEGMSLASFTDSTNRVVPEIYVPTVNAADVDAQGGTFVVSGVECGDAVRPGGNLSCDVDRVCANGVGDTISTSVSDTAPDATCDTVTSGELIEVDLTSGVEALDTSLCDEIIRTISVDVDAVCGHFFPGEDSMCEDAGVVTIEGYGSVDCGGSQTVIVPEGTTELVFTMNGETQTIAIDGDQVSVGFIYDIEWPAAYIDIQNAAAYPGGLLYRLAGDGAWSDYDNSDALLPFENYEIAASCADGTMTDVLTTVETTTYSGCPSGPAAPTVVFVLEDQCENPIPEVRGVAFAVLVPDISEYSTTVLLGGNDFTVVDSEAILTLYLDGDEVLSEEFGADGLVSLNGRGLENEDYEVVVESSGLIDVSRPVVFYNIQNGFNLEFGSEEAEETEIESEAVFLGQSSVTPDDTGIDTGADTGVSSDVEEADTGVDSGGGGRERGCGISPTQSPRDLQVLIALGLLAAISDKRRWNIFE